MSSESWLNDNPMNKPAQAVPAAVRNTRAYDFLLAFGIFLLDQLTKHVVATRVALNTGWVDVIPGLFAITHVQNRGAAFSLFADGTSAWKLTMLIGFSVIAMIAITWFLWKGKHAYVTTRIALAMILGGAVGNLWDRLLLGHVTDFLHFYVRDYSWPDFNVADSAIVVGALLLIAEVLFTKSSSEQ